MTTPAAGTLEPDPAAHRERWGLPSDYPMVAPSYADHRSTLAHQVGLDRMRPSEAPVSKAGGPGSRTEAEKGGWNMFMAFPSGFDPHLPSTHPCVANNCDPNYPG